MGVIATLVKERSRPKSCSDHVPSYIYSATFQTIRSNATPQTNLQSSPALLVTTPPHPLTSTLPPPHPSEG